MVEALEEGAVIRDAETKVAGLEAELGNLKIETKALKTEVEGFRAERKKQKEKEREIPPVQFKILKLLPSEHAGGLKMDEIATAIKIPLDEAELYVGALEDARLVGSRYNTLAVIIWYRTKTGNQLVVAKRWAGEEEERKAYKHADLPQIQHEALLIIAAEPQGGAIFEHEGVYVHEITNKLGESLAKTRYNLRQLQKAGMATDGSEDFIAADYSGLGPTWTLLDKGEEYLGERDLL